MLEIKFICRECAGQDQKKNDKNMQYIRNEKKTIMCNIHKMPEICLNW